MVNNSRKHQKVIIGILLGTLAFITAIGLAIFNPFQSTLEIAVVSSLNQLTGQNNVNAVKLYLDTVNKAGGIQGKQVVLSVYDDEGQPEVALKVAQKIVKSKAIAVIGHETSRLTLAASEAYKQANIPVISGSATADQLGNFPWFFRTVFSNQEQAVLMANYAKKILNHSQIGLVYTNEPYGRNLGTTIVRTFETLGGKVVSQWGLSVDENFITDGEQMIAELKSSLAAGNGPEILIAAMSFEQSGEFIRQLRSANINLPILGGDSFSDLDIIRQITENLNNPDEADQLLSKITAVSPVIFDVLDDEGQQFKDDFEQKYSKEPGWTAACFYDGAVGIVAALKNQDITGKNPQELRSLVIKGLKTFDSPDTAFTGAGRLIYFDRQGNSLTPAYMGVYDRKQLVSAFTQLQLVKEPEFVTNLEQKVQNGEIIKIGDRYLQKTNIVYVGMDINELNNLDEATSSYLLDFYLWFRYQGNIPGDDIEFTNYSVNRLDSGEKLTLNEPIEVGTSDGVNYKIYRIKADFTEIFNFQLYPFDRQNLTVRFRHKSLTRDQLIYVVDLVGMRGARSDFILEQAKRTGAFRSITSWIVERVQFFQNTLTNSSTLGDRQLIDINSDIRYSQFNANIHIRRDVLNFSIKNLLPLLFFVLISYFLMFLPLEHISIEAVSGLLLAVVFYHLSLIDRLPDSVGYTVLLDYAFYVVYALLGLQLLIVVIGNSEHFKTTGLEIVHLMRFGRIAFPVLITISAMILVLLLQGNIA